MPLVLKYLYISCLLKFNYRLPLVSRILVTETGFGFVFGFINHLQVVTAINYHTVPAFPLQITQQ
jgi:hypothetical protein